MVLSNPPMIICNYTAVIEAI